MKAPDAITLDGRTFTPGLRVRCHYGDAVILTLYPPALNKPEPAAMLDRGPAAPSPTARYPIVKLRDLEAVR